MELCVKHKWPTEHCEFLFSGSVWQMNILYPDDTMPDSYVNVKTSLGCKSYN